MNIRTIMAISGLLMAAPYLAAAQIELSCRLDHSRVVRHEPVVATVRIQNNTAQTLRVSDDPGDVRLRFMIERSPGRLADRRDAPVIAEPRVIPPRRSETVRVVLSDAYDLRSTGPYTIRARMDWAGSSFASPAAYLDVVPGYEVTRMAAAAAPDGDAYRAYRILTLNRDRGEHVFLRIDDPSAGMSYGVIYLGRIVRQFRPQLETDDEFNVHVLHQTGPARFAHHTFTPRGRLVQRTFYSGEGAGVRFEVTPDGGVQVHGATASFSD